MAKTGIKGSDITQENVNKLLAYSDDEIAVTSADEKQGIAAALVKRSEDIKFQINSLKETSGINQLDDEDKRIKQFLDRLKVSLNDINQMPDNSIAIINVHNDEVVAVQDGEDSRYETEDQVVASYVVEKKTSLVLNDDVNYLNFLTKLVQLEFKRFLKLGKVRVQSLDDADLIGLLNQLNTFGLLEAVTILPSFFTELFDYNDHKQTLIDEGYIHSVSDICIDKAKNRQLSLFRDEEEVALDIIPLDAEDVSDVQ